MLHTVMRHLADTFGQDADVENLWVLTAAALNELHERGEDPRLEAAKDWRENPTDYLPGIRRTPEDGRWARRVEWTNASGSWAWTVVNSPETD
jgi:hypothetical protein